MVTTVILRCTHPEFPPKELVVSEAMAEKLRPRFERVGWTVEEQPEQ